jgi:metaxin
LSIFLPNVILSEALRLEVGASEPWPTDVQLYQPYEVEQVLLPDNANILTVQAFLNMSNLEYTIEMRSNAEHMSPSGRLPFIRANKFIIAEVDPIVSFVNTKGITLTGHLDAAQKADMRAYMSLVSNVLGNAETYLTWMDNVTYCEVTKPRYGSVYPWPLNHILTWQKKQLAYKRLSALGWTAKSLEEVYQEVEQCCVALSERLDNQQYFFDDKPTELDALVFGHLFSILTTPLPDTRLASIVRSHKNLVEMCQQIDKEYFDRLTSSKSSDNFEKL